MEKLYQIDVGARQGTILPPSNKGKVWQNVSQNLSMTDATMLFESFFKKATKDFVDDYDAVFSTTAETYKQNQTNIGRLTVQYNRYALRQEFLNKIRKATHNYDITFQKPTNDLELYEWVQGFDSPAFFEGISTKDDNFASGFCMIQDSWETGMPFNDRTRYEWASKLAVRASETGIKDLYVFIPSSNRGDNYTKEGINIHFVPTSDQKLNRVSQWVRDNKGVMRDEYIDDRLASPNSFHLRDIALGPSMSEHFIINMDKVATGENRFNENAVAEELVGEALEQITTSLQPINTDALIKKSPFTFLL